MVSVHTFYFDDPSSIPAGYLNFLYENAKITEKEARVGPFFRRKKIFEV